MIATTCHTCAVTYRTDTYDTCPSCEHAYEVKRALMAFSGLAVTARPVNESDIKSRVVVYGSDLPYAKLSEEQVRRARVDYAKAQAKIKKMRAYYSVEGFALRAGVSPGTMYKAIKGISWAHVVA